MRKILLGALALLAGCTVVPGTPDAAPRAVEPVPTAPPAACLLDPAAIATATGIGWTADAATASDTRCVYDPDGGGRNTFVVVELTPDGVAVPGSAALCDDGTRTDLPSGGLVCRFGDGVFGAGVSGRDTVTIAAAAVPEGTDAARLTEAIGAELDRLAALSGACGAIVCAERSVRSDRQR